MPEHNPYGEPIPGAGHIAPSQVVERVVRVSDRGTDPRAAIADTLRVISTWHECDYTLIADEVMLMQATDPECALCGYIECQNGCPMMRWRGQA